MSAKSFIPNLFTLTNLACGTAACILALRFDDLTSAGVLVLIAAVMDFFDGAVARMLKVDGEMGKQLDSLADMVSFGIVPAIAAYLLLENNCEPGSMLPYFAIIIALASGYRLAKFNIDTRQTSEFIGMPTPANALFWMPLAMYIIDGQGSLSETMGNVFNNTLLIVFILLMSYIMVSELRLFSLKFKSLKLKGNETKYLFLLLSLGILSAAFVTKNLFLAFPIIILLYIVISIIQKLITKTK